MKAPLTKGVKTMKRRQSTLKLIKRKARLVQLSTSIQRLSKHRRTMKEQAIYNDRRSISKKFNWWMANGKI